MRCLRGGCVSWRRCSSLASRTCSKSREAFGEPFLTQPARWCRPTTVTARHAETGLVRSVVSGRDGSYLLVEPPVGHYVLEVTAKGWAIGNSTGS